MLTSLKDQRPNGAVTEIASVQTYLNLYRIAAPCARRAA